MKFSRLLFIIILVGLYCLVVIVLAIGPKVRGFKPGSGHGFLRVINICSTTYCGGK
jgi:hypothetical protein